MGFLSTIKGAAKCMGRFLPMESPWAGQTPDHRAHLKADHSMCCAWHEAYSFRADTERTKDLAERYQSRPR